MLVRQILKLKSDDTVTTISPEASVTEAAEILSARRIGALIVSTDGRRPLGILSERDIVRELGRRGPACMGERVRDLMTVNVVGCSLDETAHDVVSTMTERRFRHMPVMQGDEMVGLISIGDVVKARLSELSMEKAALEGMIMGH